MTAIAVCTLFLMHWIRLVSRCNLGNVCCSLLNVSLVNTEAHLHHLVLLARGAVNNSADCSLERVLLGGAPVATGTVILVGRH